MIRTFLFYAGHAEEEEGAEGRHSDEEWHPEKCNKTKRKRIESTALTKKNKKDTTALKKGRPNISTSVRHSGRILNLLEDMPGVDLDKEIIAKSSITTTKV